MYDGPAWHSPASLAWLRTILHERFGHTFALQVQDGHTLVISLPGDTHQIALTLDSEMFTRANSDLPCAHWDAKAEGWSVTLNFDLPAPGSKHLTMPLFEAVTFGYRIHYDMLGMVYWMLSRQEEIGRDDRDQHGRFPASASHAHKHAYLERPIVDEWLHILGQAIQRVWPQLVLKRHRFDIKISHDVDTPSLYGFKSWQAVGRMMGGHLLKRHDLRAFMTAAWVKLGTRKSLHPADPFNTFDWLMDQAEANGLKSAFYFICGRTNERYDADYELEHPAIRDLLGRIHVRGHEIGLHPSYDSYQKPEVIAKEFRRLRQIASGMGISQPQWGGRMHYLRWEQPTTLRAWVAAGMDYDNTMSYADRPGFRCGTCFDYQAFDPLAGTMLPLRIRPLIVMESSVIESAYLGLGTGEAARKKIEQLQSACAAVHGSFTLLWHNSSLAEANMKEMYASVLRANYTFNF